MEIKTETKSFWAATPYSTLERSFANSMIWNKIMTIGTAMVQLFAVAITKANAALRPMLHQKFKSYFDNEKARIRISYYKKHQDDIFTNFQLKLL